MRMGTSEPLTSIKNFSGKTKSSKLLNFREKEIPRDFRGSYLINKFCISIEVRKSGAFSQFFCTTLFQLCIETQT